MQLTEAAPAKVNLFLAITGRRPDRYHLLDSLVVFADAADRIHAAPADRLSLRITGRFGAAFAPDEDNLVLRAARALADHVGVRTGARLTLEKHLPIASGIGGGSADAAATLRLLCRLWDITLDAADLAALALRLGADVPVCLASRPARMTGIGEHLAAAPELPPFGLLLVNPGAAVATAAVFQSRIGTCSPPATLPPSWRSTAELAADLACTTNDLQSAAISLCPAIADVLAAIEATESCRFARMSGSGATCFGLYDTPAAAAAAAGRLSCPPWWCHGGGLHAHEGLAPDQRPTYCTPADWGVAKR